MTDTTELHLCHRCLVRLEASAGGVDLPRRVRETLQSRGLGERTRIVPAPCLGRCPTGQVTVLVIPDSTGRGSHSTLIDPERDGEDLVAHLEAKLRRAPRP
ncbi:hypothetical protein [Citreicoccus inhibens]|uniref:hypothetical protein n=1 Tax=Citreicoccus inhibens TaxID=2849499 RepID=UPI0026AC64AD|nr:hypothetical protein [Citreicoccus inhibens]